jgi:hypothetical protein
MHQKEGLCVYETIEEAQEAASGCDYPTRIVSFTR